MIKKKRNSKYDGFTLIEMLIVLVIIAVLVLLFVPNLSRQQSKISENGREALEKVVNTQAELYRINENTEGKVTYEQLKDKGYLTEKQVKEATDKGITVE